MQSDITITGNDVNPQDSTGFPAAAIYAAADSQRNSPVRVESDIRLNTVPAGRVRCLADVHHLRRSGSRGRGPLVNTGAASANCTAQLTSTNTGSASGHPGCALIAGPINTPP